MERFKSSEDSFLFSDKWEKHKSLAFSNTVCNGWMYNFYNSHFHMLSHVDAYSLTLIYRIRALSPLFHTTAVITGITESFMWAFFIKYIFKIKSVVLKGLEKVCCQNRVQWDHGISCQPRVMVPEKPVVHQLVTHGPQKITVPDSTLHNGHRL